MFKLFTLFIDGTDFKLRAIQYPFRPPFTIRATTSTRPRNSTNSALGDSPSGSVANERICPTLSAALYPPHFVGNGRECPFDKVKKTKCGGQSEEDKVKKTSVAESRRDSGSKPRVARYELPWETAGRTSPTPTGLRQFSLRPRRHNPVRVADAFLCYPR